MKPSPAIEFFGTIAAEGVAFGAEVFITFDDKQKTSAVAQLTGRLSTDEDTLTVGGLYSGTLAALL
ncbi:hypothetical protein ACP70R_012846 [Stipagrostis hirtigluma subsp. patula]